MCTAAVENKTPVGSFFYFSFASYFHYCSVLLGQNISATVYEWIKRFSSTNPLIFYC